MMKIIREHYARKDDKPKVIEDWLNFMEGAICNEILLSTKIRPFRMDVEFSRVLFDENPEDPALKGLVGYRVTGVVHRYGIVKSEE